jgi:hypothetical protein
LYECETKGFAGKACWKLLKIKGDKTRGIAKARMMSGSGGGEFEASQPRIAYYYLMSNKN